MTLEFSRFSLRFRFSFFAVLALMLLLCDESIAMMCFLSSMLHESGHLLMLLCFRCPVKVVTFGAAGIVIERESGAVSSTFGEVMIALGGVLMNGLLCLVAVCGSRWQYDVRLGLLFWVNVLLAGLNLLPVEPLDAARALSALFERCFSPEMSARLLRGIGLAATAAFTLFCAGYCWWIGWNVSLLAVWIYLILLNLKRSSLDDSQRS